VAGCACAGEPAAELVLASTTSTEDSGLFDVLLPAFAGAHPEHRLKLVAVGTGQAMALGRRGDADVLLVHAPAAESAFVAAGHGTERRPVMHNEFVLVGPAADPAGTAGTADAAAAFARVAARGAPFVSRGDDSGTHRKELELWRAAGVAPPSGGWYLEVGQGMADALTVADERRAYTLTDRATFLSMRSLLDLTVHVEGDRRLFNPYGVIPVAGARNAAGARAFAEWITGAEAQALIASFGVRRWGMPLFVPASAAHTAG
jgi:tungstate transport system substrate-binding protein